MTKTQLIIDTDGGHDDILALLLLIKSDLFDIKAITTVAGNSEIEKATRNINYALALVNRYDIPVFSGASKPLKRELITANVHGKSGLDGANVEDISYKLSKNAASMIAEIIKADPNNVSILTLGPLTNIAEVLDKNPNISDLIKEIVIMGGAINVPGNKSRVAEFNIFVDPESADIVFKSNTKKVLIPIDICNSMIIDIKEFEAIKSSSLYEPIISMMKPFLAKIKEFLKVDGLLIYDAVAGYYLINHKAFDTTPMDIVIETKGEHTSGMTIAEKRIYKISTNNVNVALNINQSEFKKDLFETLNS